MRPEAKWGRETGTGSGKVLESGFELGTPLSTTVL